MKKGMKQIFRQAGTAAVLLALTCGSALAQEQNASSKNDDSSNSKEEGNRNVMLNAASANGPREIQIGLPSADVNVLENGIPVTYATNPHSVNSLWRADASLSHVGLLKISETAITTGNIGYAVNSFTQLGQKGFNGTLNYKSNHFGMQEFSLNLNATSPKTGITAEASIRTSTRERSKSNRLLSRTAHRSISSPSPRSTTKAAAN